MTTGNWSGYAISGANGSVTDVKGSWFVPAVNCSQTPSGGDSSFWLGIDGFSSNTVEQVGTDSDCVNGRPVYYAWYEFYPHFSYTINSLPIQPGDSISAEVKAASGGKFTVTLSVNHGTPFSISTKMQNAKLSSAEWVAEAPYSGGILPLADFGSVTFASCEATVSGVSGPIGPFSKGNVSEITMVGSNGQVKARPSALSATNDSFSDAWMSAGP